MKYIIELEKIEGTNLYKAKGANTLVFDEKGIANILRPYHESEPEVDWTKVAVDTPILVKRCRGENWRKRHFAKYENGEVFAWDDGKTSFTKMISTETGCSKWNYAKLAEVEQ